MHRLAANDPGSAATHAGLSLSYLVAGFNGIGDFREVAAKARTSAQKALEIDAALPAGHLASGILAAVADEDFIAAEREFQLATRHPKALHCHASFCLLPAGRFQEAIQELTNVCEADPVSITIINSLGWALRSCGRFDDAIARRR